MTTIRRGLFADLAALVELEQACFADAWSADGLRAELEQRHARVYVLPVGDALPSGPLSGALLGWLLFEDLHVNRIAVHPDHRRQGLGQRLMDHALRDALAQGAESALLEVRADNTPALALYRQTGFVVDGLRKGYYPGGLDAVLMRLDLRAWQVSR